MRHVETKMSVNAKMTHFWCALTQDEPARENMDVYTKKVLLISVNSDDEFNCVIFQKRDHLKNPEVDHIIEVNWACEVDVAIKLHFF